MRFGCHSERSEESFCCRIVRPFVPLRVTMVKVFSAFTNNYILANIQRWIVSKTSACANLEIMTEMIRYKSFANTHTRFTVQVSSQRCDGISFSMPQ